MPSECEPSRETPSLADSERQPNRLRQAVRYLGATSLLAVGIVAGLGAMHFDADADADKYSRQADAYTWCATEVSIRTGTDDQKIVVSESPEGIRTLAARCRATLDSTGAVTLETAAQYSEKAAESLSVAATEGEPMNEPHLLALGAVLGGWSAWGLLRRTRN